MIGLKGPASDGCSAGSAPYEALSAGPVRPRTRRCSSTSAPTSPAQPEEPPHSGWHDARARQALADIYQCFQGNPGLTSADPSNASLLKLALITTAASYSICTTGDWYLPPAAILTHAARALSGLRAALRRQVDTDKDAFLEDTAARVAPSFSGGASMEAWAAVKTLAAYGGKRFGFSHQPIRQTKEGNLACTPQQIADTELRHFAEIESAKILSPDGLCQLHSAALPSDYHPGVTMDLAMTRAEVTASFSRASTKKRKTPGPDQINDGLLSAAPASTARHAHCLLTKCALTCTQPLAMKGAIACAVYKGKGSVERMEKYRSILLENNITKHYHAFLRNRLAACIRTHALAVQCSAGAHRGVDMASLLLHAHRATCKQRSQTAIYFFSDVRSAYYSCCRELFLQLPTDTDDFQDVLDSLNVPLMLLPQLITHLQNPSLPALTDADDHLREVLKDAHLGTWFTTRGGSELAQSRKGTRPGDPFCRHGLRPGHGPHHR